MAPVTELRRLRDNFRRLVHHAPCAGYGRTMPRVPRSAVLVPGGVYHVTTRGNNCGPIYLEDDERHLFLNFFRKTARRLRWLCHEWYLMTTHYHLLVATPDPDLHVRMHWL